MERDGVDELEEENKRRLELKWRRKKKHNLLRTWARDWLVERIVEPAETLGRGIVTHRMDEILEDLMMTAIKRNEQDTYHVGRACRRSRLT